MREWWILVHKFPLLDRAHQATCCTDVWGRLRQLPGLTAARVGSWDSSFRGRALQDFPVGRKLYPQPQLWLPLGARSQSLLQLVTETTPQEQRHPDSPVELC